MQQSEIDRTKEILNYLDNENVQYLDYSAYNEEEHDEKYKSGPTQIIRPNEKSAIRREKEGLPSS